MKLQTCFVGCSYTAGSGFVNERFEENLWTMLLHCNTDVLAGTEYVNLGIPGGSNEQIFTAAAQALASQQPKFLFVQWTSYPRFTFLLGLETYKTYQTFSWEAKLSDHNLHDLHYNAGYLQKVAERFLALEHPHNQIENIVRYCNILVNLSKQIGTTVFFINGACSWDKDYFVKLHNVLPNQYTTETQKLLQTATRDDSEVFQLYDRIHSDYQQHGGIQSNHWLNLYQSLRQQQFDTNQDNRHPGIQSNRLFFKTLSQSLADNLDKI